MTHTFVAVLDRAIQAQSPIPMPDVAVPSQGELFDLVIARLQNGPDNIYHAIRNIEDMSDADVRLIKTAGTPLEGVEQALADIGIPTDGTAGALMDSPLALNRDDIHDMACFCIEHEVGHAYTSHTLGALVSDARNRKLPITAS